MSADTTAPRRAATEALALRLLRFAPPETAHRLALVALKSGLAPKTAAIDATPLGVALGVSLWDRHFAHPVGVAAGFDKNAEAPDALLSLGAAFVEIGAVTPRPQVGNPKPRLFRLVEDKAVINRMGFNNDGLAAISARLATRRGSTDLILANLGANKDAPDRVADYVAGVEGLWGLVGGFTVNVSSPNTEKLRDLQGAAALSETLGRVIAARNARAEADGTPLDRAPVLVKIAPDLTEAEIDDVAAVALEVGVDGVIATNTTTARPETLRSKHAVERGGLSGPPLFERSTEVLRRLRRATAGRTPLIGVGGVSSAAQAYAKIRAGASLVQLYTGLAYGGPQMIGDIAYGLAALAKQDGLARIEDAVGLDA